MSIIGLDLSLSMTGMACIGWDWGIGDQAIVAAVSTKKKDYRTDAERMLHIADQVVLFCKSNNATHIYAEDVYGGPSAKVLLRLRGVVEAAVWTTLELPLIPVNVNTARKHLLGRSPGDRKLAKKLVLDTLKSAGMPVENDAHADAACIGNYGRYLLGKPSLHANAV